MPLSLALSPLRGERDALSPPLEERAGERRSSLNNVIS
jgi:hypothetical protein